MLDRNLLSQNLEEDWDSFSFQKVKSNGSDLFFCQTTGGEFGKFIHTDNKLGIKEGLMLPAVKKNN